MLKKVGGNMSETIVVNIKDDPSIMDHPDAIYIGRYNSYYNLPESKWANHHPITRECGRDESILLYTQDLLKNEELLKEIKELKGKILVCWCKPANCHGDVLARLANAWPDRSKEE